MLPRQYVLRAGSNCHGKRVWMGVKSDRVDWSKILCYESRYGGYRILVK